MKQSYEAIESTIAWGSMLIGVIACLIVGWRQMRAVRRGTVGRLRATLIQAAVIPVLGLLPLFFTTAVKWLAYLGGVAIFSRDGGNDGILIGVGIMGIIVAVGAAVLFAAVMLFQSLTGVGSSDFDDKE